MTKSFRLSTINHKNHMVNHGNIFWKILIAALPIAFILSMTFKDGEANAQNSLLIQSTNTTSSQQSGALSRNGKANNICEEISLFNKGNHIRDVLLHQLPETLAKNDASLTEIHDFMTERGWLEATHLDYGISYYQDQVFEVQRVQLTNKQPPAWVFSTAVGSLDNPLYWILSSTSDGKKADHLLLQLGSEGSGYFDTAFLRFQGTPFAVTIWRGEIGSGADIYSLDPGKVICSFYHKK